MLGWRQHHQPERGTGMTSVRMDDITTQALERLVANKMYDPVYVPLVDPSR